MCGMRAVHPGGRGIIEWRWMDLCPVLCCAWLSVGCMRRAVTLPSRARRSVAPLVRLSVCCVV